MHLKTALVRDCSTRRVGDPEDRKVDGHLVAKRVEDQEVVVVNSLSVGGRDREEAVGVGRNRGARELVSLRPARQSGGLIILDHQASRSRMAEYGDHVLKSCRPGDG